MRTSTVREDHGQETTRSAAPVAPVALVALSVLLITFELGQPPRLTFDEVYYVDEARDLLERGVAERRAAHPPLGTWAIAAGIATFGDNPIGWRSPGAMAGVLTVWLTYLIVLRLTSRRGPAVLAGLLLAGDGVFLAQARIAMLDIHLTALVTLGVWLLLVDRRRRTAPAAEVPAGMPWALLGAGTALGMATAVKWSGLLALAAVAVLATAWEVAAARRERTADRHVGARVVATLGLAFVVSPLVVYVLAWGPWLQSYEQTSAGQEYCPAHTDQRCLEDLADHAGALVRQHRDLLGFHWGLEAGHRYRTSAATWPLQSRPVTMHWAVCDETGRDRDREACDQPGTARHVLAVGNLALWSSALVAVPALVWVASRRAPPAGTWGVERDAAVVPVVLVAFQYLPWLLVARPVFSFYAVPLVPFLAVAVAVATCLLDGYARVRRRAESRMGHLPLGVAARWLLGLAALALLLYFAPVWMGLEWDAEALQRRWWRAGWT